jgi:4-hydroxybenzoate polyprenyltransferase
MEIKDALNILRPARMAHFALMSILGVVVFQRNIDISLAIFLSPVLSAFLWQITTMINDLFDVEIDILAHPERPLVTGKISRKKYVNIILSLVLLSILLSVFLSLAVLLLSLLFIILAVLYSVPPLRMRNRVWGTVFVGLGSAISYFIGYFSYFWPLGGNFTHFNNPDIFGVEVGIFILIALSIAPNINSYEDFEGDKKAGVKNIYTVMGRENGRKTVSFLIFIIFILPPFLLFSYFNLAISVVSGMCGALYFYKKEEAKGIFILYFLNLLYYIVYFLYFVRV